MTYTLWNMDNLKKELANGVKNPDGATKILIDEMYGLVEEANKRHNDKMLHKDIEIASLKGTIEVMKNSNFKSNQKNIGE